MKRKTNTKAKIKTDEKPLNSHLVLHDKHLEYTRMATKLICRLVDDVSTLEDRVTLLERGKSPKK